jgi:hypothetical protein
MIDKVEIIELAESYFKTWSNRDLKGLAKMFTEDCILRDWEISAEGKEDVLAVNKNIFDSVDSIKAIPLNLYFASSKFARTWQRQRTVIAELEIIVNENEKLLVTDVIEFKDNKIKAIRAYKGN